MCLLRLLSDHWVPCGCQGCSLCRVIPGKYAMCLHPFLSWWHWWTLFCLFPIIHVNVKEKKNQKNFKRFLTLHSLLSFTFLLWSWFFSATVLIVSSCCSMCAHLYFPKAVLLKHKKVSRNLLKCRFSFSSSGMGSEFLHFSQAQRGSLGCWSTAQAILGEANSLSRWSSWIVPIYPFVHILQDLSCLCHILEASHNLLNKVFKRVLCSE